MKGLKQLGIILTILWVSTILTNNFIVKLPPTIVGMFILFMMLKLNLLKLSHVDDISQTLFEYLPFMFLPIGVGVINVLDVLREDLLPILIIVIITLIIVIVTTGLTIQFLINIKKKGNDR
ncbi:MAG: CidA/LrgA family protein [Tissierellales bacterium]|jgi:holin-like protein|nr:CidA/LrgA family protein [Tissierellales bacterium]